MQRTGLQPAADPDLSAKEGDSLTVRTSDAVAPRYSIIVPEGTMVRAADYLKALRGGRLQPGAHLRDCLQDADLQAMTEQDLLARLFDTVNEHEKVVQGEQRKVDHPAGSGAPLGLT